MPQTSPACRPASAAHGPIRASVLGVTAAALTTLPAGRALALDLDGDMGIITETVASRDRLKSYGSNKMYGAERVADRDRKYVLPDGVLAGNYLIFPSLGAAVVYDDNIFKAMPTSAATSRSAPSARSVAWTCTSASRLCASSSAADAVCSSCSRIRIAAAGYRGRRRPSSNSSATR